MKAPPIFRRAGFFSRPRWGRAGVGANPSTTPHGAAPIPAFPQGGKEARRPARWLLALLLWPLALAAHAYDIQDDAGQTTRFVVAVLSFLHLQFEPFSLVNGII